MRLMGAYADNPSELALIGVYMIQSINLYQFREAFATMGRKDQFSYTGLESLFNYFEELAEDTGEEQELDVISLCCDYTEDTYTSIASDYDIDISDLDAEDAAQAVIDYLNDHTSVLASDDASFILYCSAF